MSEGSGGGGGGGESGSGSSGGGGDVADILAYLYHWTFGHDGDYTGNAGYGGDNTGPPGARDPEPERRSGVQLPQVLAPPPRSASTADASATSDVSLAAFVGGEVDPFSGQPVEVSRPDAYSGARPTDVLLGSGAPIPSRTSGPVGALRPRLLSSPYLLADNAVICDPIRTSCLPPVASDARQSSLANTIQAELDESHAAIQALAAGQAQVMVDSRVDMQQLASQALQGTKSDEYKLAASVNQLRSHPLEVRRSAALTGMGHMAGGIFTMALSGAAIYGTGGLAFPLIGAMGFASGAAETASGLALAVSGADSTEVIRMTGQLDYVFSLTSSPASLVFGTTGLVLTDGDVETSHRFAVVGGILEDLAQFRGDPSKLYSAIVPGTATAAKGASALLLKDVAALGYRARADSLEQIATKLNRDFTVEDLRAITAFREEMGRSGRLDLAGAAGHAAAGAAGSRRGVDFSRYDGAFQQELKLHGPYTWLDGWYLDKAATQSLNYSIKYQLETRALGEQLVPLRSVKHIWISPTEAIRYVK